jgi:hypothetical protein
LIRPREECQAEKFAREKANGGSHPTGSRPDDFPKKAESAPRGSPDTSETRPAPGEVEHFDHFEQPPETAHNNQWPKPDLRIVEDGRAPSPTLDDDALPAGWGEWITKEAAARDCPRDYLAAALIVAASAWIGNSRHVAVNETWREPPHLWIAEIGAPSTGKTPAQRPIIETCRVVERDAEPEWQAAIADHARLAEAAKAHDEQWCAEVRAATKTGQPAPDRPPGADAPDEPPRPRLVAMDATTEELQHLLSEQPRGLLYVRDELTGWFGNHDRYGGNGGDRAFFLEAWNGGSTSLTESNIAANPCVSRGRRWRSSAAYSPIGCARRWRGQMTDWLQGSRISGRTRRQSLSWRTRLMKQCAIGATGWSRRRVDFTASR